MSGAATIAAALRPATLQEAMLLLEWANDPQVRRHAFHAEAISWTS